MMIEAAAAMLDAFRRPRPAPELPAAPLRAQPDPAEDLASGIAAALDRPAVRHAADARDQLTAALAAARAAQAAEDEAERVARFAAEPAAHDRRDIAAARAQEARRTVAARQRDFDAARGEAQHDLAAALEPVLAQLVAALRPRLGELLADLEPVQHLAADLTRRHLRAPANLAPLLRAAGRLREAERELVRGV